MLLLVFVDREESGLIRKKKAYFLFSTRNSDFVLSSAYASFFFLLSKRTPLRLRFSPLFNTND